MPSFPDQRAPGQSFTDDRFEGALFSTRSRLMRTARASAIPVASSLGLVGFATACLFTLNYFIPLNLVALVYLLPVVFAATRWGIVPAVAASIAGAMAADFFFYPPLYSLWIHDPQHVIDLIVFLFVAVVTSNLAARLKKEADSLRRREAEMRDLYTFSQRLAACFTSSDLVFAIQDYLSNTLGYRAFLIPTARFQENIELSEYDKIPEQIRLKAAELIAANAPHTRIILEPSNSNAWLISIVSPETSGYGAIAIDLGQGARERIEAEGRRVEVMLEQAAKTLKHLKIAEAIEHAKLKYQADMFRDALVGGVSHELRTPLASILGSASVLSQTPAILNDSRSHGLVEAIQDQAGQLDADIRNLLDATRVTAKGFSPRLEWADPTDLVHLAISQKRRRLAEHPVHLDLQSDLPLVKVDSALVEQALGQLLDNAAKYSPAGSPVTVLARLEQHQVVLSVIDKGAGLTVDDKVHFGRRSFRGQRHLIGSGGSGLGLWVASTFIAANGGTLDAVSQGPDRGTTVSVRLPVSFEDQPALAEVIDE